MLELTVTGVPVLPKSRSESPVVIVPVFDNVASALAELLTNALSVYVVELVIT